MAWFWTVPLNGLLGLGAYWTARYGFRQPAGLPRGLAAAVLAWTWVTVGLELLGVLGALAPLPLLGWTALGLLIGFGFRSANRSGETATAIVQSAEPWEWSAVLALGLTLWAFTLLLASSFWLAVKVVSDGPIYHLYFAARWWKAGRLFLVAAPFGENAATYFPAVGDLWFTWLLVGWGGDRLAKIGQVPFYVLGFLAAFGLARRLGAGRSASLIASTWFGALTPLLLYAVEPNVDSIFVAGYLMAAYFFLRHALDDDSGASLALGALASGGALGTKPTGVVFVPLLLALVAGWVAFRAVAPGRKARDLGLLFGLPMVMAGFWYARNAWLTGNPLYPLQVEALGRVWLQGWYGSEVMRYSRYAIPVGTWQAFIDIVLATFDPRLAPVWLAALLGAWRPGRKTLARWVCLASALAVANVALYWFLIPYRTQQRFMFHAAGLAAVPLARMFDRGRGLRWAGTFLLAVHLLTPQGWPFVGPGQDPPWDLSPWIPNASAGLIPFPASAKQFAQLMASSEMLRLQGWILGVGGLAMATAWAWCRLDRSRPWRGRMRAIAVSAALGALATLAVVPSGAHARRLFFPDFRDYYAAWLQLDLRAGPSGVRIAYAGTDIPFYLLGVGLRNEARYVNVDRHRDWLLHDYHREARANGLATWPHPRPGWDRMHPNYEAWVANLRAERIQVLVVARVNPAEGPHNVADSEGFPIERRWADSHPEIFTPIYGVVPPDPRMKVYRVRPPESDGVLSGAGLPSPSTPAGTTRPRTGG